MIHEMRRDYRRGDLDLGDLAPSPIDQFLTWFEDARAVESETEANAMTVATVGSDGRPTARVVLLKGVDASGFRFFTSYLSRKASDIAANPFAALVFFWPHLERQVRIEGRIQKRARLTPRPISALVRSEARSRRCSRGNRVRSPIETRSSERSPKGLGRRARPITFDPDRWGGYLVVPDRFEFWQGRPSRLHDRFSYTLTNDVWNIERLYP
ncbi:MAG: pyridoxal 5'-phosphate synthase [Thermomicrobiales bacterium]